MLHSKYTTPPARLEEMKEELKNYEHYGGGDDEGPSRHLNFWNQKQKSFPELKPPPKTSSCYCGEFIIRNNYLYSDRVLLSQMVRKRSSVSNVQDSAQRDKIRPVHSVSNKQINTATLFQCGLHDSVAYTARCRGRDAHLEHVTVGHWHQESEELSRILLTAAADAGVRALELGRPTNFSQYGECHPAPNGKVVPQHDKEDDRGRPPRPHGRR